MEVTEKTNTDCIAALPMAAMPGIALLLLLILISICCHGQKNDRRIFDSLYQRAEYDKLLEQLNKELAKSPKNENLLREIGYVYIAKNKPDLGEKYYAEALKINPDCGMCYFNLGRISIQKNDYAQGLKHFDKAIELEPNAALFYSNRARLKEYMGDNFRAFLDFNKCIALEPSVADHYIQRGLYNKKLNYSAAAILDFSKAIALDSGNYKPYFERASVYYEKKQINEAFSDINRAIELDSEQDALYTGRGALYDVLNDYEKAINDYSKAIALNANNYLPFLNRANSKYRREDMEGACNDYYKARELVQKAGLKEEQLISELDGSIHNLCDSSKASYYYQRGIAFYNLKKYEKSLEWYAQGLQRFPENPMLLAFQGNAFLASDQFEKAITSYSLSIQNKDIILYDIETNARFSQASVTEKNDYLNGTVASSYFSMAESQLYLGQYAPALQHVNKAIETMPNVASFNKEAYYNLRGRLQMAMGKNEIAISDFNKSIAINKLFAAAYVNRAVARVNLFAKPVKTTTWMAATHNFRDMHTNWTLPQRKNEALERELVLALQDCDTALEADKESAFAFYIRGLVKKLLANEDYCMDLLKAKSLGLSSDAETLSGCK